MLFHACYYDSQQEGDISAVARYICLLAATLCTASACADQNGSDSPAVPAQPAITASATGSAETAPGHATDPETRDAVPCTKQRMFTVGDTAVWQVEGKKAFYFSAGMAIDADGAPDAYHPDDIGKDFLANAGRPGNWWALVTDNGKPDGRPLIQQGTDPKPGFYIAPTSLEDRNKATGDPMRYVDANTIPFLVLPSDKRGGARLGDFAVVINRANGKTAYAIFADLGPRNKIGEASIALAERLGIPSNPRRGGASKGVVYVVFPNSGNGKPRTLDEIESLGEAVFRDWGGMQQLEACLR